MTPLIYLPRAARFRKYSEIQGGQECHSGAGSQAGAPVMTAAISNSTTAERLSAWRTACDVGNTSNFMVNFHKKSPMTSNRFRQAPILTSTSRKAVCTYLAMIDYPKGPPEKGWVWPPKSYLGKPIANSRLRCCTGARPTRARRYLTPVDPNRSVQGKKSLRCGPTKQRCPG
jgi:hypothetical protein